MNCISSNAIDFSQFATIADAEVYNAHYIAIKHLIQDLRLQWQPLNKPIQAFKD
jgi:hypothetical protein